jgi:hypothetical protein
MAGYDNDDHDNDDHNTEPKCKNNTPIILRHTSAGKDSALQTYAIDLCTASNKRSLFTLKLKVKFYAHCVYSDPKLNVNLITLISQASAFLVTQQTVSNE